MRILKGAPLAFTSGAWTSCATELQMPLTALRNVDDWTWCRWTWHAKMCMKGTPKTDNTIDLGDPPNKNKYGTVTLQLLVKTSSWSAEVRFGKYPRVVVKGIKVAVQPFLDTRPTTSLRGCSTSWTTMASSTNRLKVESPQRLQCEPRHPDVHRRSLGRLLHAHSQNRDDCWPRPLLPPTGKSAEHCDAIPPTPMR